MRTSILLLIVFLSPLMMPLASSEPPSGNITQLSATPIKDGDILIQYDYDFILSDERVWLTVCLDSADCATPEGTYTYDGSHTKSAIFSGTDEQVYIVTAEICNDSECSNSVSASVVSDASAPQVTATNIIITEVDENWIVNWTSPTQEPDLAGWIVCYNRNSFTADDMKTSMIGSDACVQVSNGVSSSMTTSIPTYTIIGSYQVYFAIAPFDSVGNTRYIDSTDSILYEREQETNADTNPITTELSIIEIGPFRNSVESYALPNGTEYPVVFLKESFHIKASLFRYDGLELVDKCLNIYIDSDENPIPISTIQTNGNGMIEWFSGDPLQNPSVNGIETTNGKLEGLRTLKVSYEPEQNVTGGCDKDSSNQMIGSYIEVEILVQSRVDLQVMKSWNHMGENTQYEGSEITGEIILLRDRLELVVVNEEIIFSRQYISTNNTEWITDYENISTTDELGKAQFNWIFDGKTCSDKPCSGIWRVKAHFPGSFLFAPSQFNLSFEVHTKDFVDSDGDGVSDHLDEFPNDANETKDSDGDGVGDNSDDFPNNPDVQYIEDIKSSSESNNSTNLIAIAILVLALVIFIVARKQKTDNKKEDDGKTIAESEQKIPPFDFVGKINEDGWEVCEYPANSGTWWWKDHEGETWVLWE